MKNHVVVGGGSITTKGSTMHVGDTRDSPCMLAKQAWDLSDVVLVSPLHWQNASDADTWCFRHCH